jgi:hypothetical protein
MSSDPERPVYSWIAPGLLAVLIGLAAIPVYMTLAPGWRPVAIRVACAALVIAGCVRVTRMLRSRVEPRPPSALDAAPRPARAPELDDRFVRLRGDVRASLRSRRYHDVVLWPRLVGLAGSGLRPPPERRGLRWLGVSAREIERAIAEVEKRA